MPPSEPNYPAEWLRIAEKDWRRVKLKTPRCGRRGEKG